MDFIIATISFRAPKVVLRRFTNCRKISGQTMLPEDHALSEERRYGLEQALGSAEATGNLSTCNGLNCVHLFSHSGRTR